MKKSIFLLFFLVGFALTLIGCDEPIAAKLTVSDKDVTLQVNDVHKISALLKGAKEDAVINFSSSDDEVADVSTDGTVTAIKAGTATITITVSGYADLMATVKITVEDLTDQITYSGPSTVVAGQSITISATDKLDSGYGVMWVALTPSIAKVTDGVITGVSAGKALFEIHSMENGFNITIEIEVTEAVAEKVEITANLSDEQIKTSANYKLDVVVFPKAANQEIIWETSNDAIADINQDGFVTIATYGEVTFTAKSVQNHEVFGSITVEFYWDVMDLLDYVITPNPIIAKNVTAVGYQFNYQVDVLGSVSNYYFGTYPAFTKIAPLSDTNRPGTIKTSTEYITIHDTASSASSANAQTHANYVFGGGGGTSWHYSIGNDGVWLQIPLDEVAYHAGDGSRVYTLNDTGVKVTTKVKPKIGIDPSGYYTLNGVMTSILVPLDGTRLPNASEINSDGITLEIGSNGNWMMNSTWWSSTYKKIGNYGGNRNSIGIETMVNQGSDLYLTWHYTAKKASELALQYNLGVERITTHHFFSGKNCPQTLRDNGLYPNFRKMIEAEYLVNKFLGDYTFTFVSNNPDLVDNTGRILKIPDVSTKVSFLITVQNNSGFNQSKLYYSTIPGK